MRSPALPDRPLPEQAAYDLKHWNQILADPYFRWAEGRVESDRFDRAVVNSIPPPQHGRLQATVGSVLKDFMRRGHVLTVCPISTADGVKAVDVCWASDDCWSKLGEHPFFFRLPEICVESSPKRIDATNCQRKWLLRCRC